MVECGHRFWSNSSPILVNDAFLTQRDEEEIAPEVSSALFWSGVCSSSFLFFFSAFSTTSCFSSFFYVLLVKSCLSIRNHNPCPKGWVAIWQKEERETQQQDVISLILWLSQSCLACLLKCTGMNLVHKALYLLKEIGTHFKARDHCCHMMGCHGSKNAYAGHGCRISSCQGPKADSAK